MLAEIYVLRLQAAGRKRRDATGMRQITYSNDGILDHILEHKC